jgi:single-strand DNA-binding protein
MSVNKVIVMGRLGKDVDLRKTVNGKSVASFSVGCSEKWTDKNGQKQEKTEWVRCTCWEKTADIISQYFKKGDGIFIEGKFKTDVKEENGSKTYHSYVLVENFTFPEGKSPKSQQQQQAGYQQMQQPTQYQQQQMQQPTQYQHGYNQQFGGNDDMPF